jgi:predicted nucleotidyltransferase
MNFERVIAEVGRQLDAAHVRYALIGGFAMALRGVQRATMDLDFILMIEDLEIAHGILEELGYRREFHSKNVSHYLAAESEWGRIDILHAFRKPTLGMLERSERLRISAGLELPVVHMEDLIGLKVQASVNDPTRAIHDWDDIRLLLEAARCQGVAIDWGLVEDYLRLFGLEAKLAQLKIIHGATE